MIATRMIMMVMEVNCIKCKGPNFEEQMHASSIVKRRMHNYDNYLLFVFWKRGEGKRGGGGGGGKRVIVVSVSDS